MYYDNPWVRGSRRFRKSKRKPKAYRVRKSKKSKTRKKQRMPSKCGYPFGSGFRINLSSFENICWCVCQGHLDYSDFTAQDIITLLEKEGVELSELPELELSELQDNSSDIKIRILERLYKENPTKEYLLYYAYLCQRYGVEPQLDFCDCSDELYNTELPLGTLWYYLD
jgi:hypothetical protein